METMETLTIKIASLEKGQEKQEVINNDIFVKIEGLQDNKVSYKMFFWILGVLLTVLIAICTWISTQLDSIRADGAQVKNQVSYIDGVFKDHNLQLNQ